MSSNLVQEKIKEAIRLDEESRTEEAEGLALAQQVQALQSRAETLLQSSREKRAFSIGQMKAAETLTGSPVAATAPAAATTKGKKAAAKASKKQAKAAAAVAVAPPTVVAAAPKAAKAPKAKKAAAAGTPAKAARVVSAGEDRRPPLHERLKQVVGSDSVNIADAIERLRAKDWLPESDDLKAYISLVFSTHTKDIFERVSRGIYRVRKGAAAAPAATKSTKGEKKVVTAKATNGTQNPSSTNGLEELGTNVLDNPFAATA